MGNRRTLVTIGAHNYSNEEREKDDYYATDPNSLEIFLKKIKEDGIKLHENVWECACGEGNLSKVLEKYNYKVKSTDLINRGYGTIQDFLKYEQKFNGDILTNPPYKYAKEFIEQALKIINDNNYCIMFLRLQFLEGKKRQEMFKKNPPKYIYIHTTRQACYINGNMNKKFSSATCYCWYIWEKGFNGEPKIRWL